jgi:hypothetical protein
MFEKFKRLCIKNYNIDSTKRFEKKKNCKIMLDLCLCAIKVANNIFNNETFHVELFIFVYRDVKNILSFFESFIVKKKATGNYNIR